MTWFTDSPFERIMVQRPKMQQREQNVPAVLLTERDHAKRKQHITFDSIIDWFQHCFSILKLLR